MRKYSWFIIVIPVILGSCRHFWGRHVHGNGNARTEEHSVSDFTELEVSSTLNVHVVQGDLKPIKIEADENLLQYIEVEQDGDRVIIRNKHGFDLESSDGMSITVSAPKFRKISVSGAGDIVGENKITGSDDLELNLSGAGNIKMDVDVPKLSADISGVGSMYLKGQTKDVELSISGAGSAHCYDLLAENNKVEISGVGSAEVYASVKLDAQVSGAGSVNYKGNAPEVKQHVSGVGSVNKE
ncbi:MAG TPA: head GIN domain-containing protein [Puia sp.]|nr:head GIN domain-containing protein [Puia sp.]